MKNTKKSLFLSLVSLLLCCSMLVGTTFAWFTDSVSSGNNRIVAGNLDVTLEYFNGQAWTAVDENTNVFEEGALWEPGHTEVVYLRIGNAGTLALDYKLGVNIAKEITSTNVAGEELKLSDHILMGAVEDVTEPFATREAARAALDAQAVSAISAGYAKEGTLYSANAMPEGGEREKYVCLVVYMPEEVGNEANYKTGFAAPEITLGIDLLATQQTHEQDSFGNDYDTFANPDILATMTKTLDEGASKLSFNLTYGGAEIVDVIVPAEAIADPTQPVTVTVDAIDPSITIAVGDDTKAYAYDITVTNLKEELTEDQLVKVVIYAPNALPTMKAYHNGELIEGAEYNEVAGTITFKTDSFSPYAFEYTEKEAGNLEELRAAVKEDNVEIKLTQDLTIDLTAGSADRNEEHAMTTGSGAKYYNAVNIIGENVAIDLNGYKITVKCSNTYNGNKDVGALFYVNENGSLNIIDRAGNGFIKMASSIYMVWAPYASPSYVDIYNGAFIADSYAGDPIGTSNNPGSADGTMQNENSNRALIYAGTGGNMNIYGGYFLYNNTPNDVLNRNNGAFNATNGYEGDRPFITIHEGVLLIDKAYRQDPTHTDEFENILEKRPDAKPTDPGIMDNSSIKLAKDCGVMLMQYAAKVIDGRAYSNWYTVVKGISSITANAKKNVYNIGHEFTADDFAVYATSANGSSGAVSEFTISDVDTTIPGSKAVTISYKHGDTTITTTCVVQVLNLGDTTNTIKAPNGNNPLYQQYFNAGNFNVSGWANQNGVAEPSYANMVGKTYEAPNGEIATGFNLDIVNGTYGENYYDLTVTNAKQFTTLGINCLVAYSDTNNPVKGFGCYIDDDRTTLTWNSPAIVYIGEGQQAGSLTGTSYQVNNDIYQVWGANNAYSLTSMNCANLKAGKTYTVHWVVLFEDGLSELSQWTVKMADLSASDAMFEDTIKPNANVIIMAGQSNMFGASPLTATEKQKLAKYDYSNVFIRYNNINFDVDGNGNTLSTLSTVFSNNEFQKYQPGIGGQSNNYFGPEAMLAAILSSTEGLKEEKWFIVKYAAAGTALSGQWTGSCQLNGKTVNLTDDMLDYVETAIGELSGEYDVKVQSFMWMQGESDAINKNTAEGYAGLERSLVERVRNRFAANATRTVGSIPGSGISFVNAGIADNDTDLLYSQGGPNDWVYAEVVNAGKISNCQWLCSIAGAQSNSALTTGPLKGYTFGVDTPTIPNPNVSNVIVNSIYIDTHHLLSKLNSTGEHDEYVAGDRTDWAHYGAGSMNELGSLYASCLHYLMINGNGPIEQKITYDAANGTVDGESYVYKYVGEKIILPSATRPGHTFKGWFTAATGGELIGAAGAEYVVVGSVTMYAQWEVNKYTVTFDPNGGTCSVRSATYEGTALALPEATRTGYTFNGWYTAASGGTKVGDAGATNTPTADITLYAQWTRIQYTVTYEANGGSVSPGSVKVNAGDFVTLPTPARDGYTFKGWYNAASGGTKIGDAGATYTPEVDITLYAQWEEKNDPGCVTPDTLITLADGTKKRIDQVVYNDQLLVWDFAEGEYVTKFAAALINMGEGNYRKISLSFANGTVVNVLDVHGFFDMDLNKFVFIKEENVQNFIGHHFAVSNDNGFEAVKLIGYSIENEFTTAYSMLSAEHYNVLVEGVLSITPYPGIDNEAFYACWSIGENMTYDADEMQKKIDKHGVYSYEDWAKYGVTYEQYVAANLAYIKVVIGEGVLTFNEAIELIKTFLH